MSPTVPAAVEAAARYHAAQQALGAYRPGPTAGSVTLASPAVPGAVVGIDPEEFRRLWGLHVEVARAALELEEALSVHGEPVKLGWWEYRINFESGRAVARRRDR